MSLRQIKPLNMPNVEPAALESARPEFREIGPHELFVDAAYQRNLSERSVSLIRKIVAEWSWAAFKPPALGRFKPGETIAIAAIRALVRRRFPSGARRVPARSTRERHRRSSMSSSARSARSWRLSASKSRPCGGRDTSSTRRHARALPAGHRTTRRRRHDPFNA